MGNPAEIGQEAQSTPSSRQSHSDETISVVVTAVREAAENVKAFELRRADGGDLPAAEPGAHVDVHLPGGVMRQYSLMNAGSAPDRYLIGVKLEANGRGGSRAVHELFKVGTTLEIGVPRNHFSLAETAAHTVLIAGGIGVTPLWSMAQRLTDLRRSWRLHYFVRNPSQLILPDAVWANHPNLRPVFSSVTPRSNAALQEIVDAAPPGTHFYCCGPATMLNDFKVATAHLPSDQVHLEHFGAEGEVDKTGAFKIELARSGKILEVPAGKTIVEVLSEAGIEVLTSCTEGYCGTCETRVLSGIPDHRDVVLNPAERSSNTVMMICCSRSISERLVLDL